MGNEFDDPLEGHPQTVSEKIRRGILLRFGIFPGILGKSNEANFQQLTRTKASTILDTEAETGRKIDIRGEREGG